MEQIKTEKSLKSLTKFPAKSSANTITKTKPIDPRSPLNINDINKKMINWIHKQRNAKQKLTQIGLKPEDSFKVVVSFYAFVLNSY